MRPFRPIAPAVAFCLLLCAAGAAGQTLKPGRPAMDASLAEATYRAVMAHLAGELRDAPPDIAPAVLCLALGDADAPASVLDRLSDVRPPVRPASACRLGPRDEIVERSTGRPAWDISVDTVVTPRSRNEVALDASYYVGPLWGGGWRCIARREEERWTVACRGTWVSLAPDERTVPYVLRDVLFSTDG